MKSRPIHVSPCKLYEFHPGHDQGLNNTYLFQIYAHQHTQTHHFDNQNNVICDTFLYQAEKYFKKNKIKVATM